MAEEPELFIEEEEQEAIYAKMVQRIFFDHYKDGVTEFVFDRSEILKLKAEFDVEIPRNPGDLPYKYRFRSELPDAITKTQPQGLEWLIELAGRARYRFKLGKMNRVLPREELQTILVPDATPEIIRAYRMKDEQALLAIIRYNRVLLCLHNAKLVLTAFGLNRNRVVTTTLVDPDIKFINFNLPHTLSSIIRERNVAQFRLNL